MNWKNVLLIAIILASPFLHSGWPIEEKKINYLINSIRLVEGKFIRNGEAHTPVKAAEHLSYKLKSAQSSWFSQKKEKWTAEMFIKKIASRSSISGKNYEIILLNGKKTTSEKWLKEKLNKYESKSPN
jgi:hypothetical protein